MGRSPSRNAKTETPGSTNASLAGEATSKQEDPWRFRWPNTADFNFNYYHLLDLAMNSGIAANQNPDLRVAIVGAGIAGLVAARELFRCGYTNIDIYEASERIGGRTYSVRLDGQYTTMEMGAMRMPFFDGAKSQNCVLDFYRSIFSITTQDFPNPGTKTADTGVWVNGGYGPDFYKPLAKPTLLLWKNKDDRPPTDALKEVYDKWDNFAKRFTRAAEAEYTKSREEWESFWHAFVQNYWAMSFRDFVYREPARRKRGYFGGLGMNQDQANLFYVIGAGDGGWGAFYDISCLFPIRTLLFGYGKGHQLIQGKFDDEGNHAPGPQATGHPTDSLGHALQPPDYLGVESFADCLFYEPVRSDSVEPISLYKAIKSIKYEVNLYTRNEVKTITRRDDGTIRVESPSRCKDYDAVVITPATWALQMSVDFEGFDAARMPFNVQAAVAMSHWITSCKVFFPLTRRFWQTDKADGNPVIPQTLVTDTFLQGVYGYGVTTEKVLDPGVLLASYTWEDDANKLLASTSNDDLAQECLNKLDAILMQSSNRAISPYVNRDQPHVIFWAKEPTYHGCAKLTRPRSWDHDYTLLRYNQDHSADSGVYCAGEAYSVEGGWTEPALRMAIDAVVHIVKNTKATFVTGFDYERHYPKYSNWKPELNS
ncbi:MAG TPA: FAD-dependent oxidoreductase [Mycobacterium sp.]|nr:FAD-dependent oxidoreductase [Mycobacterium sp.]HTX96955.1 FAD-dependent oxidoreductase [Mycobacterium sp.]